MGDMRIERPACPFRQFFMFGIAWIADCAEEVVVSGQAADVFGRSAGMGSVAGCVPPLRGWSTISTGRKQATSAALTSIIGSASGA